MGLGGGAAGGAEAGIIGIISRYRGIPLAPPTLQSHPWEADMGLQASLSRGWW